MRRKLVLLVTLMVVLTSLFPVAFRVQIVEASGTIYIRADGSVYPDTAPLSSADNVTYFFEADINESIVVERNNIVVNGAGYTLEGTRWGKGIDLTGRSNVTIKNVRIKRFEIGIYLYESSNSGISGNNITNNDNYGIYLYLSLNNTISGNNVTNNRDGILLTYSSNNTISENKITANYRYWGVRLESASNNNTISRNNMTNNDYALSLIDSSNNNIYGNNMTNNDYGFWISGSSNNLLANNLVDGSQYGFYVTGSELSHYLHSIETSNLVDGKPVYYLVSQQGLTINPSTHPQIGFLALVNSANITIEDLTLTKNYQGLLLAYTNNSKITNNNIIETEEGIDLHGSSNNTIYRNGITANYLGINPRESDHNKISENKITNNEYGMYIDDSSNNTVSGNSIANNEYAIEMYGSNNSLYLNNFVNNTDQVYSYDFVNFWVNGVEGNYWSDYNGTDSDHDGICDIQYEIDPNNIDHYPLMGMFHSFDTQLAYHVNVISNSTIEDFTFFESNSTITMHVSNSSTTQSFGFCRVCIPKNLMSPPYTVIINDGLTEALHFNDTLYDNDTHRWIYFAYEHSTHEIDIIPEFPAWTSILRILVVFTVAIAIYKRRLLKTPIH